MFDLVAFNHYIRAVVYMRFDFFDATHPLTFIAEDLRQFSITDSGFALGYNVIMCGQS